MHKVCSQQDNNNEQNHRGSSLPALPLPHCAFALFSRSATSRAAMFCEAVTRCSRLMPALATQMIPQTYSSQKNQAAAADTRQVRTHLQGGNNPPCPSAGGEEERLTCRFLDVMDDVEEAEEELVPSAHHEEHGLHETENCSSTHV